MIARTHLLTSIFIMTFSCCCAQQLERQVIASGGDFLQGNDIHISYTIGETFVTTRPASVVIVTEGFQQTDAPGAITGIDIEDYVRRISFFPNPVSDQLQVTITTDWPEAFCPALFDQTGKEIIEQHLFTYHDGRAVYRLDVAKLSAGTYTLLVQPHRAGARIGFKIIKVK